MPMSMLLITISRADAAPTCTRHKHSRSTEGHWEVNSLGVAGQQQPRAVVEEHPDGVVAELIAEAVLVRVVDPLGHPVDGNGGRILRVVLAVGRQLAHLASLHRRDDAVNLLEQLLDVEFLAVVCNGKTIPFRVRLDRHRADNSVLSYAKEFHFNNERNGEDAFEHQSKTENAQYLTMLQTFM